MPPVLFNHFRTFCKKQIEQAPKRKKNKLGQNEGDGREDKAKEDREIEKRDESRRFGQGFGSILPRRLSL